MEKKFMFLLLFFVVLLVPYKSYAITVSTFDMFNETEYSLTAPEDISVGEIFSISLTVIDSYYTNNWVASNWSLNDNETIVDGSFFLFTSNGSWNWSQDFIYNSLGNHTIEFLGLDLGHGSGAHNWADFSLSTTINVNSLAAIPEPSAFLLFCIGLLVLFSEKFSLRFWACLKSC